MEYYTMKIAGLERHLPICKVNDELSIYVKDGIVDSVVTGIRPGPIGE